jgi:hypothetical protein
MRGTAFHVTKRIRWLRKKTVEVSGDAVPFTMIIELVGTLAAPLDQQVTIGTLSDDVLLEVFEFYLVGSYNEEWFTLAHVCQRWRCLVSTSPGRLNLRLVCRGYTPPGEMLGRWPTFPIVIQHAVHTKKWSRVDNTVAALKHKNRVSKIKLYDVPSWHCQTIVTEMQEPFPKLDYLEIRAKIHYGSPPVLPDSFLGGSAPLLADLHFDGIPLFRLPKLLLSANDLRGIFLLNIPHSEYFSPEEMAAGLSAMNHLQLLEIQFTSWSALRASQPPHPITRIVLPALFWLRLRCTGDYLEGLVARMDALPALQWMVISLLHPLASDISELPQFIRRINAFEISDQASICTYPNEVWFTFSQKTTIGAKLTIIFMGAISSLLRVCCASLPSHQFERLEIRQHQRIRPIWEVENELPGHSPRFSAVKNLFLNKCAAENAGSTLKACPKERVSEVFPALQHIFVEELQPGTRNQKAIRRFATARRLAGLPVTLHNWEMCKGVGGQ